MLEDTLFTQLATIDGPTIVPVAPSADNEIDLTAQPLPSICYVRHSTQCFPDLTGHVNAEVIDVELLFTGNSWA